MYNAVILYQESLVGINALLGKNKLNLATFESK